MKIINGKYAAAHVMTDDIEQAAIEQVQALTDAKVSEGCKIAIMPDVHAGKGCTIGTVMTIKDRVCPNLVGVDIGCGVLAVHLGEKKAEDIDFQLLQEAIDEYVPSGRNVHPNQKDMMRGRLGELTFKLSEKEATHLDRSLGTLGGGNHFISIESGKTGNYLLIHSGSRHLGVLVAQHHQRLAEKAQDNSKAKKDLIDRLKREGREHEISAALRAFPEPEKEDLAYLSGAQAEDYLNDMKIAQDYARANRLTMAIRIVARMGWAPFWTIESVHNYIDTEKKILRKGAVAAEPNSGFLVPLNMRDGTLIYMSKGENGSEWLDSAPHGAGRRKSRTKARAEGNLEEYKKSMEGIWSASVNEATLDENPNAYKDANSIIEILDKNFTKIDHLIPVFNFKANS